MKRAWIDAATVFGVALLYLLLLPNGFSLFDEGIVASIAERVYRGETLYRDVFTHWTPGSFWLTAALYCVFGVSVTALRLPLAFMGAGAAVLVWRLARDHAGRGLALWAGLAAPLLCYPIWWMASPHWYSTFAALAATLAFQRSVAEDATPSWLAFAGALCGLTVLFLQPVGVWLTGFASAAVAWDAFCHSSATTAARRVGLFVSAAALPVLMTYSIFAAHGALGEALYDTVWWNLGHYRSAFQIAYGTVPFGLQKDVALQLARGLIAVIAPLSCVIALAVAVVTSRRTHLPADRQLLMLAAASTGVLAGNYSYPDVVHLAAAAPPAFAVTGALLQRLDERPRGRIVARSIALLLAGISVFAGAAAVRRIHADCNTAVSTSRGTIMTNPTAADDLGAFLRAVEQLAESEPIFVYPYAPGLYFLTGRRNPTRYEYLFPYLPGAHPDNQLAEVAAALEAQQTRYVVLSPLWGEAMLARYDTVLERYIRAQYHVFRRFSRTVLLERDGPGRVGPRVGASGSAANAPRELSAPGMAAR